MKKLIWPIDLVFLQKVDSTNQYARKYTYKKKNWIVIWSMNQTQGIGGNGNLWHTEKDKNLTFSIIFKPINPFPIKKKYIISVMTSNAIHKSLLSFCNQKEIFIKWPNDIFLCDKKIGGILIENSLFFKQIHTSIIGIGLNIHQTKLKKEWNASSLKKIFHMNFELYDLFYKIIFFIQKEYLLFTIHGENLLRKYYIDHLYLRDKISLFYIYKIKKFILGTIRSITDQGFLIIEFNNNFYFFSQKEIKFFQLI
ncbi:biotin/lipoate A/B protein ligase family protein [Blattabacterium sp. (Blattella germanica) str. Bge]|uniref:biotin--[acetyl-CoA-carboxylase] ligase n=1 Tax=Blattabacterium sp. (Blattella germanica) TaxID=624186 RepID=UPI0001BB6128|nr:biotin--[acetyl-CoA-carboxylase] ligase [Blattabacterium sp. (Blattella germanica)]ACY40242.1 biotin/lipoate A/B protein ligase family protein [Blattabacterium sp. (Blattella germanica) str. Bge]